MKMLGFPAPDLAEMVLELLATHDCGPARVLTPEEWKHIDNGDRPRLGSPAFVVGCDYIVEKLEFGPYDVHGELRMLAEGCGYEMQHDGWGNLGFTPCASVDLIEAISVRAENVYSTRYWQWKRDRVYRRAGARCELCRESDSNFSVVHAYAVEGRLPWQYPDAAMYLLCGTCRRGRLPLQAAFANESVQVTDAELEVIRRTMESVHHWYDRDLMYRFLSRLVDGEVNPIGHLQELLHNRHVSGAPNHPLPFAKESY